MSPIISSSSKKVTEVTSGEFPCSLLPFSNQQRKSRHCHFRSKDYTLGAIWTFLLDVSVVNAFICYRDCHEVCFANADAKAALASQLQEYCNKSVLPTVPANSELFHLLAKLSAAPPPQLQAEELLSVRLDVSKDHCIFYSPTRGRCVMHQERRRSHYYCSCCGVFLHSRNCFYLFHHAHDLTAIIESELFQSLS